MNNHTQQQFGKMAGSVLNSTFSFQMNFSAKLKVNALKSATSPSCETLAASLPEKRRLKNQIIN
jgi:hypothetical protein